MKKILAILTLGLMASLVHAVNFIVPGHPAYEPFANATTSGGTAYTAGTLLAGQTNAQGLAWVLVGTTNTQLPVITNGTLSYPGLLPDAGNSVFLGGSQTGNFSRWDFNSTISGSTAQTLYYSMLMDVTSLATLTGGNASNGVFVACFNNASGATGTAPSANLGARLLIRTNGLSGYNLGVNKADGTPADYAYSGTNCAVGTTYFVVVGYTFSGSPSSINDSVSIWVNPATNTFGSASAPTADASTAAGANIVAGATESILSFMLRQNNASEPTFQAASVSVGLAWADVTPLPSGSVTPVFSNLASTNTTFGTSVTLSGNLSAPGPLYPTNGETVTVAVNGNPQSTTINDSTGDFTINYNPGSTPVSLTPYTVMYTYAGSTVFAPATNTSTTLSITNPLPVVLNGSRPFDGTSTVAAGALYVSNAVGGDVVTVASGTATLAGSTAGVEPITSFGLLTLGGANSNNYTLAGASGSVTVVTSPVIAGHPIFEPFNDATASNGTSYPVGANLTDQTNAQGYGWYAAGSGSSGPPTIAAGPLTVPGLIAVSSNSVTVTAVNGASARLDLGPLGSSTFIGGAGITLYYSMAFQVNTLGTLSATPSFVAGFNNSAGTQAGQPGTVGARLYTRLDGSGYDLGIDKNDASTNAIVWETNTYSVGTTYFIVAAYSFSGTPGASNDTVSLWVNPATNTFGGASAPAPDVTTSFGGNMGSTSVADIIASFILRQATTAEPGNMTMDDISVGVTWADVTPTGNVSIAPFPILAESIDHPGGNFILTWQSVPGSVYQVLGSATVNAARNTWTNVGAPITASGTNTSATNAIGTSKHFFGVVSP